MKEKRILSLSIGCAAFILCLIMFTQFKTVEQTDITAIETMRETELRAELASWKEKYDEIETKLEDTQSKITEYQEQMSSEKNSTDLLSQELAEAQKFLGLTDVEGQGIIVILKDNDFRNIDRFDLISLINELKLAGAEAISVNDERVVTNTDVALINNRIILVNGKRISGPYTIKAIGDQKYLESAITIKGGYVDEMKANEKNIDYELSDKIEIHKFEGDMKTEHITVNK